jgi:hypothetical protein
LSELGSTFFSRLDQLLVRRGSAYRSLVLGRLQDRRGEPALRTRALAALVIVGLVVLTAPLVVVPFVSWVTHHLF